MLLEVVIICFALALICARLVQKLTRAGLRRVNVYRIERAYKERYVKLLGFYSFDACPCGCTDLPGAGLQLYFFGVSIQCSEELAAAVQPVWQALRVWAHCLRRRHKILRVVRPAELAGVHCFDCFVLTLARMRVGQEPLVVSERVM